jgi:hypothetical protein
MNIVKRVVSRALASRATIAVCIGLVAASAAMGAQGVDRRKETTIVTSAVDVGSTKGAIEVRYLNVPFGETTFGYLESGGSDYYSTRTWPFAHLKLATSAKVAGKTLSAGDYVLYVTPKSATVPMSLSVASFKPGASGTFLVAGNVFTETPKDAVEVVKVPVTFTKGGPSIDHLEIVLDSASKGAEMKVHYGDRWLSQTIEAN